MTKLEILEMLEELVNNAQMNCNQSCNPLEGLEEVIRYARIDEKGRLQRLETESEESS